MYHILDHKSLPIPSGFSSIDEVFKALQIVCFDSSSNSLSELLKTNNGSWFKVTNAGYEMTLEEIKYYE